MADPRLARPSWRGRTNVDALTIACIEAAERIVGHEFLVTQGSYQSGHGDVNSAGTHDLGGVVDLRWCGHDACILALRISGMAATWHRTPSQGPWPDHIHAVVRDHPFQAASAQRQTSSVLRGGNGLKYEGPDDGPRPRTFPHPVWPPAQEDDMASPEIQAQLDRIDDNVTRLIKKAENSGERERRTNALLRKIRKDIADVATLAEIDDLLTGD